MQKAAGRNRGAMAGAFRQEDVIGPFKDPKVGETPDALGLRFNCKIYDSIANDIRCTELPMFEGHPLDG